MSHYPLSDKLFTDDVVSEPIRAGFGRGLKAAGEANERLLRFALILPIVLK